MFNRNANLSGRRPLLDETHARPRALVLPRPADGFYNPNGPSLHPRAPYDSERQFRQPHWKPSNVELEKRLHEIKVREKVGYFHSKITPPERELDRKEAELVFRFDPSADYVSNQYRYPSVQYTKCPPPRVPDGNGPFVFGVHGPGHFRGPDDDDDDDYDYSEVAEENGHAAIPDSASDETNCCDKVNEWTVRDKTKSRKLLNRFEIKDRRKVKSGNRKEKIKCVLLGDGAVGKTSLITAYAQDEFHDQYRPTAFDTFNGKHNGLFFFSSSTKYTTLRITHLS